MLHADNVSFAYHRAPVLSDVSVRVEPGHLLGILGPNGSGKTTLLRLLAGMAQPSQGRVTLDGTDLGRLARASVARRIAVVPQETQLTFDYTALEIALMGRYPHLGAFELEGPVDLAIATDALAATGTAALAGRPFRTLSGGEKQRVVIASALAQFGPRPSTGGPRDRAAGPARPEVLLLDEPTASLDLGYQLDIASILKRLNQERQIAVVVSTHDLNFAASLCRDLILLRDGRVLAAGPTRSSLTPEAVQRLYGVDADVRHHDRAAHLTVVPIARTSAGPEPRPERP